MKPYSALQLLRDAWSASFGRRWAAVTGQLGLAKVRLELTLANRWRGLERAKGIEPS